MKGSNYPIYIENLLDWLERTRLCTSMTLRLCMGAKVWKIWLCVTWDRARGTRGNTKISVSLTPSHGMRLLKLFVIASLTHTLRADLRTSGYLPLETNLISTRNGTFQPGVLWLSMSRGHSKH